MRALTSWPTTIAALAVAAALTACSSSTSGSGGGSGSASSAPSTSAPTTSAPTTSAAPPSSSQPVSSTAPSSSASSSHVANEVDAVLLTPAEVGSGFVSAQTNPPGPLPCAPHDPPVTEQVHNTEMADAVAVNQAQELQFEETVYVYGSVSDAVRHQRIDEKGLACATGSVSGTKIAINGPANLKSSLTAHTDVAQGWDVASAAFKGSLLVIRIHAVIVELSFLAQTTTTPKLSVKPIVERALAKIINGH